jgi:5-methylcytosine-specific restriction endonuclease McrA
MRQEGKCYWCSVQMEGHQQPNHPRYPTGDHLIPLFAGGKTKHGNIVAACFRCNTSRNGPETNHRKQDAAPLRSGDDTPRSPFEILKTVRL